MSQVNSIAGNDGFSRIRDLANQVTHLNGVNVSAVTLNAETVHSELITGVNIVFAPRNKKLITVNLVTTGSTWWTAGTALAMNKVGTSTPFQFEATSVIVAASFSGVGLAGAGATISAGPAAATGTAVATVLGAAPFADVNTGVAVGDTTGPVMGTTGVNTGGVAATASYYFTLQAVTASLTAGVVYATITYYHS